MATATFGWRTASVLLALRPLASVFTCIELLLLVLFAFAMDQHAAAHSSSGKDSDDMATHSTKQTPASQSIAQAHATQTHDCSHESTETAAVDVTKRVQIDLVDVPTAIAVRQCLTARVATAYKISRTNGRDASYYHSCCTAINDFDDFDVDYDSCSTSDTSDMASQTTPHALQSQIAFDAQEYDRLSELDCCSKSPQFDSLTMSQCSSEFASSIPFLYKRGELLMRRESVFTALKPWRKCSVLLSIATGELFVHRKSSSAPPQVLPLASFTGAWIHPKRRHSFKVMFDGHAPLHFRVATPQDAECWIQALEYANEATWRL